MSDPPPAPSGPVSLTEFIADHGKGLARFGYLICGDRHRAEDLNQDVLLAIYRRFGDVIDVPNPLAYARRAMVNANISWSRRAARRDLLTDQVPETGVRDRDPAVADELWQSLAVLPDRQRAVLVLRYHLGYSDAEIADTINCRRATVRSLSSRALADLRGRHLDAVTGAISDGTAS